MSGQYHTIVEWNFPILCNTPLNKKLSQVSTSKTTQVRLSITQPNIESTLTAPQTYFLGRYGMQVAQCFLLSLKMPISPKSRNFTIR